MFRNKKKQAEKTTAIDTAIHHGSHAVDKAPDGIETINATGLQSETTALETIARLFEVYQPGVVFGEPATSGDHTVITASEVTVGMGLGFGHGSGGSDEAEGEGGGGGGGGMAMGRPVAAIVISPNGVRVEPIVDVTKVAIAFFTTAGAIFMAWRAMRRQGNRG